MAQSPISSPSPDRLLGRADDFARRDPAKAVATAFGFGFLLHLLPLGALASILIAVGFASARPVLLLLGVWKAFDLTGLRSSSKKVAN